MQGEWKKVIAGHLITILDAPEGTRLVVTHGDMHAHATRVVRTQLADEAIDALKELYCSTVIVDTVIQGNALRRALDVLRKAGAL